MLIAFMLLKLILLLFSLTVLFWMLSFLLINDFSLPTKSIKQYKKILAIFPHPDDEVLTTGGVMAVNGNTTLLILTKGEKGTPYAYKDLLLKNVRTSEAQESARILKVQNLIQKDFGDGELQNKKDEIKKEITYIIDKEKPDLIITYDLSGFYGHPDHIAVSQIVTNLKEEQFNKIELWYTTVPKRVYKLLKLPEEMAHDKNFKNNRSYPSHKIWVGINVFRKIRAMIAHKSQYQLFQAGFPIPIPSAFFQSMTLYEYFYKVS